MNDDKLRSMSVHDSDAWWWQVMIGNGQWCLLMVKVCISSRFWVPFFLVQVGEVANRYGQAIIKHHEPNIFMAINHHKALIHGCLKALMKTFGTCSLESLLEAAADSHTERFAFCGWEHQETSHANRGSQLGNQIRKRDPTAIVDYQELTSWTLVNH